MSLRYSGPATFHADSQAFDVHAALVTNTSDGTYSWGGRLTTPDVAAVKARGGALTFPEHGDGHVHVEAADLDPEHGGVLLRVHGAGRAPYEQDGETA